ncbi:MAG: hypothetical protein E5X69_20085 [Mesorhizobium sp.]|nr:MAG: hypothetical protein E5X69_20085 [Mesorhizobium sp.]
MAMTPTGCVPARSSRWPRMRGRRSGSALLIDHVPAEEPARRGELVPMGRAMVDVIAPPSAMCRSGSHCRAWRPAIAPCSMSIRRIRLPADHDVGWRRPVRQRDLTTGQASGGKSAPHLRRLVRAIRASWPKTRILIRADSHYCSPQIICWRHAKDGRYRLHPRLGAHKRVANLETLTRSRFQASAKRGIRRFKQFVDGAAACSATSCGSRSAAKVCLLPVRRGLPRPSQHVPLRLIELAARVK